ncbi:unnamed protein product [Prorocentrum cordatum]|uniref:Uncharacterized protein n=1 Tax=Prorocentrum cordatum TaxID=2364126 RepID=A0ABN9V3T5_9DINO|nr:unnamed protein product [Polarella glacialis]
MVETIAAAVHSDSEDDAFERKIRSLLHEAQADCLDSISKQLASQCHAWKDMKPLARVLLSHALLRPELHEMLAELVPRLSALLPELPAEAEGESPVTFARLLLNACQDEFECLLASREPADPALAGASLVVLRPPAARRQQVRRRDLRGAGRRPLRRGPGRARPGQAGRRPARARGAGVGGRPGTMDGGPQWPAESPDELPGAPLRVQGPGHESPSDDPGRPARGWRARGAPRRVRAGRASLPPRGCPVEDQGWPEGAHQVRQEADARQGGTVVPEVRGEGRPRVRGLIFCAVTSHVLSAWSFFTPTITSNDSAATRAE